MTDSDIYGFLTLHGAFLDSHGDWKKGDPVYVRTERIDSIGPINEMPRGREHTLLRVNGRNVRVWESPDIVSVAVQTAIVQAARLAP